MKGRRRKSREIISLSRQAQQAGSNPGLSAIRENALRGRLARRDNRRGYAEKSSLTRREEEERKKKSKRVNSRAKEKLKHKAHKEQEAK